VQRRMKRTLWGGDEKRDGIVVVGGRRGEGTTRKIHGLTLEKKQAQSSLKVIRSQ
jgi:hypothetical protein